MSSKIENNSYQSTVIEIRALLANWFESGVELFLKLRDVDRSGIWKHPGHATFADFLRAEFPTALGIERYQNVVNAIDMYGVDRVKQVGIESCHALTVKALADSPEKRARVLAGIDNFVGTNGCAPDRNKVRELVSSVAPETRRAPKELLETLEIERLRVAMKEATKKISELERTVTQLRKENERLTTRAERAKTSAQDARKRQSRTRSSSPSRRT
jgi:hypothetical protein